MVGPILKQCHRTAKLAWAYARRHWRLHTWQHILFSNESRFSLRLGDGRYRVYRRHGERFTDQYVYEPTILEAEVLWYGLEFDMIDSRTQLKVVQGTLNAVKNRDNVLDPIVLSFLQQQNFDDVFQHDNARCHVARVCQDFLNQNHIRLFLGSSY